MKKKITALFLASIMGVMTFAGCAAPAETPETPVEEPTTEEPAEPALKVSMVTDVGGVKDQSFNQSAWEGLEKAKADLGIEVGYIESKQDADYEPNLETLVDGENDLIWGVGFKMADAILAAAANYPDQKYAIIDQDYGDATPTNVLGVLFKEEEPSYLVGLIAGKMSTTNKIGFIGGMDVPVINRFRFGFLAGVKAANPDAVVDVQFVNAFNDPAKGKAVANQMYASGVDIIFHAAGDSGNGAIEAAKEQNKWVIGVDRDQNDLAPDNVISSAVKRVDNALYMVSKDLMDGTFPGGTTLVFGLAEGGVDIAPTSSKNVPADILEYVEAEKQKIINKEITVPGTEEAYNSMN